MSAVIGWGVNDRGQTGADYFGMAEPSPVNGVLLDGLRQVDASYYFSTGVLTGGGRVKAVGGNDFGQLGDGTADEKPQGVILPTPEEVVAVALGGGHALALLPDGHVAAWGGNVYGTAGDGSSGEGLERKWHVSPVYPEVENAKAVASGPSVCYVLHADGTVTAWGANQQGAQGMGVASREEKWPHKIEGLEDVIQISTNGTSGHDTVIFLHADGTLSGCGNNAQHQLHPDLPDKVLTPTPIPGIEGVSAIAVGGNHAIALVDGRIIGWGGDTRGQLGIVGTDGVSWIAAGLGFSGCITDGQVLMSGRADYGCIGNGDYQTAAHDAPDVPEPFAVPGLDDPVALICGQWHVLCTQTGPGPERKLVVEPTAEPGEVRVSWVAEPTVKMYVGYREHHVKGDQDPFTPATTRLPAGTPEYTIRGLNSGVRYEVRCEGGGTGWGWRIGTVVPT